MKMKSENEVAQSCLTLSNPLDCSLPGSSVHGIFQARVLEWGVIAFSNVPTSNAEKAEVEWVYEDLQDLLELTPRSDLLYIREDWNAKVGSQEIPRVTAKLGLGVQSEAGQRLTEFCQENAQVIANTLFQ